MDMDLVMSAALWVVAGATVVSFLAAISAVAVTRGKGAANGRDNGKAEIVREAGAMGNTAIEEFMTTDTLADNADDTVKKAGDDAIVAAGAVDIVSTILAGLTGSEVDSAGSERYKEEGRAYIHQWDIVSGREQWNWELLGQAIECYVNAIGHDPDDRYAWTNLAFVYHLAGDKVKALQCLERANRLAGLGPYGPGRDYQQVARAVKNDTTLFGERLRRPPVPASFQDKYEKFPA